MAYMRDSFGRRLDAFPVAESNPNDAGYDVVILAGQSNMVGRALDFDSARIDISDPRIFQYGNSPSYENVISLATEPLLHHGNANWGMGPGLTFARWYIGSIPTTRKVLLVPVAHSGTGFGYDGGTPYTWDKDVHVGGVTNLYDNMITQGLAGLSAAGPNARLVCMLWLQGEHDGDDGMDPSVWATKFTALVGGMRTAFNVPDLPVVVGQMVPEGFSTYPGRAAINAVQLELGSSITRLAFAYGIRGFRIDSNTHYSAGGQRFVGRSFFDALQIAKVNVTGTAPLAPAAPTAVQTGTSLAITWGRPLARFTDFNVRYRLVGAGSWTNLTRATSIDNTATITGLTLGSSYEIQVRSVNEVGNSPWSATTTFPLVALPANLTGPSATMDARRASLAWAASAGATSYEVRYKIHTDASYTLAATVTGLSYVISALVPSTSYDFRVTPINAAGSGTAGNTTQSTLAVSTYLVDALSVTVNRACSVRKIKDGYSGPAIRVRRSSDNTEQDIGFSGNNLDTTALLAFTGAGNGFIVTWYDQTGNGNHMTRTVTASQFRIVNAGTVDVTAGGKPQPTAVASLSFYLDTAHAGMYAAGSASIFTVLKGASAVANARVFGEFSTSNTSTQYAPLVADAAGASMSQRVVTDTGTSIIADSGVQSPTLFNNALHQATVVDTGSMFNKSVDGTALTPISYTRSGTVTPNALVMGADYRNGGASLGFTGGSICEFVICFAAADSVDVANAQANQKAYWGTP